MITDCPVHEVSPLEIGRLRGPFGMFGSFADLETAKDKFRARYECEPTEAWHCEEGAYWFQVPYQVEDD